MERKAAAKEKEALDDSNGKVDPTPEKRLDRHGEVTKKPSPRFGRSRDHGLDDSNHLKDKADDKNEARRGFFSKRRQNGNEPRRGARRLSSHFEEESELVERPAFQSALHGQSSSNKKLQPRAVAIPYSRLKKERFYDWPPDPTVSRATPIALYSEMPKDPDDDSLIQIFERNR